MAEASELADSDASGLGELSLKSVLGEGSADADSVGEGASDPGAIVIEADGEAEDESVQSPPSDGLADSVEFDPGADSDHEAEGAGTSDPAPLSLPASEVADACSPLIVADAA